MIDRVPVSTDTIRVIVYHGCAVSATGAAFGPGSHVSYWWLVSGRLRIVAAPDFPAEERAKLEAAIVDQLERPGDSARQRQDELAEAPDL